MSVELLTLLLFGSLIVLLALGLPVPFCLGGIAIVFLFLVWDPPYYQAILWDTMGILGNFLYLAIPLFVFMGCMLERSGIGDDLYGMIHRWIGHVAGGLAMGTVFICAVLAAMVGLSAPASIMMGITALPSMLKRGYDKRMIIGSIAAGGTLGILIPPSVLTIIYSMVAMESPRRLFMGSILPGVILSVIFILYIGIRCRLEPAMGPPIPREERAGLREKFVSLWAMLPPIFLIILVLGSILGGLATVAESAAVGAAGTILCAAFVRKLTWQNLKETTYQTLRLTSMITWILIAAECFSRAYVVVGVYQFLQELSMSLPFGKWSMIILIQIVWFISGCFLDPFGIMVVTVPVFLPVMNAFGLDATWFGVLFLVNMEMAYITPPVGLNLFILKAVAPEGTTMWDVYCSVTPFVLLLAFVLVLIILFPNIVLWLPNLAYGVPAH